PLHVALGEHVDRAADVHLDEPADALAHLRSRVLVRRDRRRDGDDAVAGEQFGDEPDAPDVDVAIFFGETEAGAERPPHFVAVEDLHSQTTLAQLRCDALPDGRLAGTGQSSEPDGETAHQATGAATA